jgi:hypothetical protein
LKLSNKRWGLRAGDNSKSPFPSIITQGAAEVLLRLTSTDNLVPGNQELRTAPSETIMGRQNKKSHRGIV